MVVPTVAEHVLSRHKVRTHCVMTGEIKSLAGTDVVHSRLEISKARAHRNTSPFKGSFSRLVFPAASDGQ